MPFFLCEVSVKSMMYVSFLAHPGGWRRRWCTAPLLQHCDINFCCIILHFNQMDFMGQFNRLMEG